MIYWQIETNLLQNREELSKSLQNKVPEWAIYFEWIVSDWELNRNGYIIDSNAWFFNKGKYVKDFLKTWSVLYNHNSDQPIWRPLTMEIQDWLIKVSWYVFDDNYTNWAVWRGLILGLSTWHITHERMFQDCKSKRITEEDFWNLEWETYKAWSPWTIVVTKAEIVEFSFVTTRSNRSSTLTNDISELSSKFNKSTKEVESLFFNYNNPMKKEDIATNEAETTIAPAVEVKAEAQVETPVEAKEENKVETSVETTAILNELSELKTNFSTLENELKIAKEQNETFKSEINKLKEDKKAELINLANVPNKNEVTEVKTVEDFKNKYSTK